MKALKLAIAFASSFRMRIFANEIIDDLEIIAVEKPFIAIECKSMIKSLKSKL